MGRFDPLQRARDFTREPDPRRAKASVEQRMVDLGRLSLTALNQATKKPGNTGIESVDALPWPTQTDIGRMLILRGGPGVKDKMYIGTLDANDVVFWSEIGLTQTGVGGETPTITFVRNFSTNDPFHVTTMGSDVLVTSPADHTVSWFTAAGTLVDIKGTLLTTSPGLSFGLNTPRGIEQQSWTSGGSTEKRIYIIRGATTLGVSIWLDIGGAFSGSAGTQDFGAGSGNGQFNAPEGIWGVRVSGGEVLWLVADTGNHRIQVMDGTIETGWTYQDKWGSSGSGNGQFSSPTHAVYRSGKYYVSDRGNNRIQRFDANTLSYETKWGTSGSGDGQFAAPSQIAFDPQGYLHVVDRDNDRVQVFDTDGVFITKYGSFGAGTSQFDSPTGIAITSAGVIFVADRGNDRISVWQL